MHARFEPSTNRGSIGRMAFAIVAAGLLAAPLGGCSQSLFKRGVQRSQYETYDTMRNRRAPDYYEDEFGRQRINLRGRLITPE